MTSEKKCKTVVSFNLVKDSQLSSTKNQKSASSFAKQKEDENIFDSKSDISNIIYNISTNNFNNSYQMNNINNNNINETSKVIIFIIKLFILKTIYSV